jgi:protocatechuate 3,4-dioxygenase beta subunit
MSRDTHQERNSPVTRRQALGAIGALGAALYTLTDLDVRVVEAAPRIGPRATPGCIVTPQQTEGPYFVDERLERSDVRMDPITGTASAGVPLRLRVAVARVDGESCAPVTGAIVDIWQCDAIGVYSDVRDFNGQFDTRGRKFLRGYQVTDRTGVAEFQTIYPGWYTGRAVHIHFKVRLPAQGQRSYEFTSQLYLDESVTDQVHAQPPYNSKGQRDTRNDRDGTYNRSHGSQLMLALARNAAGFTGDFTVGLRLT